MKHKLFTLLLAMAASVGTMFAWDYEHVQIGDLYYNLDDTNQTAEVTSQDSSFPYWSTSITTANIPASVTYNSKTYSVTSIGSSAFAYCSSLTSVTIGNSVTSIGSSAFAYCSSLTSIIVESGNSVYDSRNNCNAIIETATNTIIIGCKNTIIPNSVTSIGNYAFYGCSSLTSVTIGNSVTSIGNYAFAYCSGLTSVTIPNSVTSIGYIAFYGCSGLTSVTIPNSVTSIGVSAFNGCSSLPVIDNIRYADTYLIETVDKTLPIYIIKEGTRFIGSSAFESCSGLTSVTIPNSVTSIGYVAFAFCSGLTSVTIPNSVTSIGDYAFWGCSSLTSVTNYSTTPQNIDASVFDGEAPVPGVDKSSCTLYVPKESVALYKAADVWREFVTIIGVDAPEGVENVLSGQAQGTKLIRDGQIYILRGEKEYTMQGQEVK